MAISPIEGTNVSFATDLERFESVVTGGVLHTVTYKSPNGQTRKMGTALVPSSAMLPGAKVSTLNQTTGTLPAGAITGAQSVVLLSSNALPGNQACRSAAQMLADIGGGAGAGFTYNLRIINTGAGAFTLAADAGGTVALAGASMGIVQNTFKDFMVSFPTAATCTIQETGNGAYS